jgi:hypothetical protein
MKKVCFILFALCIGKAYSQSTNDILNLLIENKSITQEQADSLRADASLKEQESAAKVMDNSVTSIFRKIKKLKWMVLMSAGHISISKAI